MAATWPAGLPSFQGALKNFFWCCHLWISCCRSKKCLDSKSLTRWKWTTSDVFFIYFFLKSCLWCFQTLGIKALFPPGTALTWLSPRMDGVTLAACWLKTASYSIFCNSTIDASVLAYFIKKKEHRKSHTQAASSQHGQRKTLCMCVSSTQRVCVSKAASWTRSVCVTVFQAYQQAVGWQVSGVETSL